MEPGLVFVSPWMHDGGIERVLELKAPWFAARGHRVTVASWQISERLGGRPNPVLGTLRRSGVDVRRLRALGPRLTLVQRAARTALIAARTRAGVLVGHETAANIVVILAKLLLSGRVRAMAELHNAVVPPYTDVDPVTLRLARRLYRRADGLVAVSHGVRRDAIEIFGAPPERVRTIHNALDLAAIRRVAASPAPEIDALGPFIVACGRLVPMKGFDDLIRALAEVRRRHDVRLVVLGEGRERGALLDVAARCGVADAVLLPGFVPHPSAWFARARAFVLSSRGGEAFSLVLVEAMACGTPVVASRCRWGPEEVLEGGRYGTLYDPGDVAALAAALDRVLEEPDDVRRLAAAAAAVRVHDFSAARILPRLASFYLDRPEDAPAAEPAPRADADARPRTVAGARSAAAGVTERAATGSAPGRRSSAGGGA